MTRIGGFPTARGLLRSCRARARPSANGSNRRTPCPFCPCAEANPRGFPKIPFRSYSQAAGRARSLRGSGPLIARTALALVRIVRFERLAYGSSCRRRRAAGLSGGLAVRRSSVPSAARAARSTTPSTPAKPANPAISFASAAPVAQTNPHFETGPETVTLEKLHFCFSLRGFRHVFTVFAS